MVSLLEKSTRYLPLGLPLPGSLLFPPFGSSSHLLSAPRLCRYPLPFFSFLSSFHSSVPLFLSKPLPTSCHPSHLPPESSPLESGQRNSKKIIIIPQKTPLLGLGGLHHHYNFLNKYLLISFNFKCFILKY